MRWRHNSRNAIRPLRLELKDSISISRYRWLSSPWWTSSKTNKVETRSSSWLSVQRPMIRKVFYEGKIDKYETEDQISCETGLDRKSLTDANGNRIEKSRCPKIEMLVASLDAVRLASLQSLYTDPGDLPADGQAVLWEVWLRSGSRETFMHAARRLDIAVLEHTVRFAEREVLLARGTREVLARLIAHTDAIAELRLNRDTPAAFMDMEPTAQIEWVDEVLGRLIPPPDNAPAVCFLDSGAARNHPLIEPALAAGDHQAWTAGWTPDDSCLWRGHGTQRGGGALRRLDARVCR